MQILAVDIGTGTQDILLYDSRLDVENGYKVIAPSPTMIVHRQLEQATRQGEAVLLSGTIMGGGPSSWAAERHVRAGLPIYATPDAARTFNDDPNAVEAMGIRILSEDEALGLPDTVTRIELKDFDFPLIQRTFAGFGVPLDDLAAIAVAVFDHGDAPPAVSDRQFRFDYLDERIRAANRLSAFAFLAEEIPGKMTRLQAVARSARSSASSLDANVPLVIMDTAPAAVLGATFDPLVAGRQRKLVANVGNLHTLAFRLGPGGIEGVFEHHTGLLDLPKLEKYLQMLADGSLEHAKVFNSHGHGALIYDRQPLDLNSGPFGVAITGPRRSMLSASSLRPYFATPFGDMMVAGCFGLLAAVADLVPALSEAVYASLTGSNGSGTAPWDI